MTERRSAGQRAGAVFLYGVLAVFVIAILLGAEFAVRRFLIAPEIRAKGAEAMWISYGNSFLQEENGQLHGCGWEESLVPHPYLGWINSVIPPCANRPTNNIGMPDLWDYPLERDPNFYSVVLVGGSVSSLMVAGTVNWLEDALQKRFVSPNGKPFRVLNGAMGASAFPFQMNFLTLYGDTVDAVVALDGYNELKPDLVPLTRPNTNVYLYVARPVQMGWKYGLFLSLRHLRTLALNTPPLRHSFLSYFLYKRVLDAARAEFEENRYDVLDRYFDFPANWPTKKKQDWNRGKYKTYLVQFRAIAEALGLKYAHFVQPVPQIGKVLTAEEKARNAFFFDVNYYRNTFEGPSEELRKKGYFTYSLLNVFAKEPATVYADAVHFEFQSLNESRGYELVAAAMADTLGKAWHLKPRSRANK